MSTTIGTLIILHCMSTYSSSVGEHIGKLHFKCQTRGPDRDNYLDEAKKWIRKIEEADGSKAGGSSNGGGGGRTMDQTIVTRNSIEAGNAANMVLELMKLGTKPDEMAAAIEELTAHADKIIDWMSGHWVELSVPVSAPAASDNGASFSPLKPAKSGGGNSAKAVEKPTNLGELLNTCMVNWALTRKDVEAIIEMDGADVKDFEEALKRVGFEMQKGEPEPATAA